MNNALDGDGPFSIERAGGLPSGEWMLIPPEGLGSLQDGIVPRETVLLFLFPEWTALSNKLLNQRLNMAATIAMPFKREIDDKDTTIETQKKRIGELESGSVLVPVLVGAGSVVVGAAVGVIIGIIVAN